MPSYEGGDWRRFSPGRLLNEYLIEWSFSNGINVFDFGIGDEDYKKDYCDVVVRLSQAMIPRTVHGWAWNRAWEAKHFLASTKVWAFLKSQLEKRGWRDSRVGGNSAKRYLVLRRSSSETALAQERKKARQE